VGGRKRGIIVSRSYSPAPEQCVRALEVLLNKPVAKEGSPIPATPDDAKVRSSCDDSRARSRIP
jgi:hypothetical protein